MYYDHEDTKYDRNASRTKLNDTPTVSFRQTAFPKCVPTLWDMAIEYLLSRGLDATVAADNGWYPAIYRGVRLVVPCRRRDGSEFWQARAIVDMAANYKRWDSAHESRGDAICVARPTPPISTTRCLVVVEGPMDALAVACSGATGIAVLGASPNNSVLEHVAVYARNCKHTILIPDSDRLGEWVGIQNRLTLIGVNAPMFPVIGAKDFAELSVEDRKRHLDESICIIEPKV